MAPVNHWREFVRQFLVTSSTNLTTHAILREPARRITDLLQEVDGKGDGITREQIASRLGMSGAHITEYYPEALAALEARRADADGTTVAAKRRARIEKLVAATLCEMPSPLEVSQIGLNQKLKTDELDDFMHEAAAIIADRWFGAFPKAARR